MRDIRKPSFDKFQQQSGPSVGNWPLQQQQRQRRVVADCSDDDIETSCLQPPATYLTTHSIQDQLDDRRHYL